MNDFDRILELLKDGDDFLILTHIRPDGDTLGSAFALKLALERAGKRAAVFNSDPITPRYFMFTGGKTYLAADFSPKVIVAVDTAEEKMLGGAEGFLGKIDAAIDHHPTNTRYARLNYVDPSAAATAEIIFSIIQALGIEITPECATALYTGIATDTGCFRFSNTTAKTFLIASKLASCGADIKGVNRHFFETKTRARFEIEKEALGQLRFYYGGKIAVLPVTEEMMASSGACDDDIDGISALPRQIEGVDAGITIREKDGVLRVSVRTTDKANAARICAYFGGGGHACAAGCTFEGDMDSAVSKLVDAAIAELSAAAPVGADKM